MFLCTHLLRCCPSIICHPAVSATLREYKLIDSTKMIEASKDVKYLFHHIIRDRNYYNISFFSLKSSINFFSDVHTVQNYWEFVGDFFFSLWDSSGVRDAPIRIGDHGDPEGNTTVLRNLVVSRSINLKKMGPTHFIATAR